MKVKSKFLGEIEIGSDQVIVFDEGIPAFETEKGYILIPFDADSPFFYLQSVDKQQTCFILADVFTIYPQYEIELDNSELTRLGIEEGNRGLLNLFAILTIPEKFKDTTANLLAPVIINFEKQVGIQYIPNKSEYNTRHRLYQEPARCPAEGGV